MNPSENHPNSPQETPLSQPAKAVAAPLPELVIHRRAAMKKFVVYTAPAVIALLTARDAAASP